ncbi:Microtubule-actin cross-linking factor 1, isoforms 1/2/3/5 [Anabarilius grahami]|uniref:Microtubule-actin cross-linking factor 1, isoforms 1/2/3/5 n=1 Tax=Anabarilius grahami TaxID=495550 RepID=A0A3N0Y2W3_ANAGA|nr:Microtubule-actin cross-linking factor 1, isoforms 1/2/3/5 [Anabarilius grahami]
MWTPLAQHCSSAFQLFCLRQTDRSARLYYFHPWMLTGIHREVKRVSRECCSDGTARTASPTHARGRPDPRPPPGGRRWLLRLRAAGSESPVPCSSPSWLLRSLQDGSHPTSSQEHGIRVSVPPVTMLQYHRLGQPLAVMAAGRRDKLRDLPPVEQSSSERSSSPGDTLPWNLPKHQRVKRSKSASGDVLDPAERAVIRIAARSRTPQLNAATPPVTHSEQLQADSLSVRLEDFCYDIILLINFSTFVSQTFIQCFPLMTLCCHCFIMN